MLVFFSCKKKECAVKEPVITFKSFVIYDSTKARLTVGFEDCDGDIGLSDSDTLEPYSASGDNYYNFYLFYWEKRKGIWEKWADLTPPFYYRTPRVDDETASLGPLKGDISINMEPVYYVPTSIYDTIKFEVQLVDRALRRSNTVFTDEIIKP